MADVNGKLVAIVIGAVIITAVATSLFFTFGRELSSTLTTSQSAHAISAASCVQDWSGSSNIGGNEILLTCNLSDGSTLHCLSVVAGGTSLYCKSP
jgi:hypothetical protein